MITESERKKYIVSAHVKLEVTVETATPECIKKLLESCLLDFCDKADVSNLKIREISPSGIPENYKNYLMKDFERKKCKKSSEV